MKDDKIQWLAITTESTLWIEGLDLLLSIAADKLYTCGIQYSHWCMIKKHDI